MLAGGSALFSLLPQRCRVFLLAFCAVTASLYLELDCDKRSQKATHFLHDFDQATKNRSFGRCVSGKTVVYIDQGYQIWRSVFEKHYLRPPLNEDWLKFRNSSIWRNGYSFCESGMSSQEIGLISRFILEGQDGIISEGVAEDNSHMSLEEDNGQYFHSIPELALCDAQADDVIGLISRSILKWQNHFLSGELCVVPWRFFSYTTMPHAESYVQGWHYDVSSNEDVIYFMLNLSDACAGDENSGTSFLNATESFLLSNQTGYISSSIECRHDDLGEISGSTVCDLNQVFVPSKAGQLLAFQPGRSLHKGVFSSIKRRDNIHISATIVPGDALIQVVLKGEVFRGRPRELLDLCWKKACEVESNKCNKSPYFVLSS